MASPLTTDYLSHFDDPPEDPLREGGNWLPPFAETRFLGTTVLDMRKDGGFATDQHHAATLSGILAYSYWTPEQWQGDHVECWGIATGGQLGAALETWRLFMFQTLEPPTGYLVYFGGGLSKDCVIRKYTGGFAFTVIGSGGFGYPGYAMIRTNGGRVEVWASPWYDLDPEHMTLQCYADDSTYRGPFWIGIGIEDPTAGGLNWTAFGGGIPHRTQIYRILPSIG